MSDARSDGAEGYIAANRRAYDEAAVEYGQRRQEYDVRDTFLMGPIKSYLEHRHGSVTGLRALDIGPGSGLNLLMMAEWGMTTFGVELSQGMAAVAQATSPTSRIEVFDFLDPEYTVAPMDAIVSKASLHLFPLGDARRYLRKASTLLTPGGIIYISVTAGDTGREAMMVKDDYALRPKRFKRVWTERELQAEVEATGLTVVYATLERESSRGKEWLNLWATRYQ